MTGIEKVLKEVREAFVMALTGLQNPLGFWRNDNKEEADRQLVAMRKALAAFTADMPGAIGECVEMLKQIPAGGRIILDDLKTTLAKLEGKPSSTGTDRAGADETPEAAHREAVRDLYDDLKARVGDGLYFREVIKVFEARVSKEVQDEKQRKRIAKLEGK